MATATVLLPVGGPSKMTAQIDQGEDLRLLFDADTVEHAVWQCAIPDNDGQWTTVSAAKLIIQFSMASGTSGKVDFEASVMAISDGDSQDLDSDSYDSVNTANATVPGTAGDRGTLTITLSNRDGMAPGDYCRIKLERDADDGTDDTAAGDCEVRNVLLVLTVS